jgi:hypothetical protein
MLPIAFSARHTRVRAVALDVGSETTRSSHGSDPVIMS